MSSNDPSDDELSEAFADALVELARHPGIHRLHILQMTGMAPPPGRISEEAIADAWGLSRRRIRCLTERALHRVRLRLPETPTDTQP